MDVHLVAATSHVRRSCGIPSPSSSVSVAALTKPSPLRKHLVPEAAQGAKKANVGRLHEHVRAPLHNEAVQAMHAAGHLRAELQKMRVHAMWGLDHLRAQEANTRHPIIVGIIVDDPAVALGRSCRRVLACATPTWISTQTRASLSGCAALAALYCKALCTKVGVTGWM